MMGSTAARCRRHHPEKVVELLVSKGADVNAQGGEYGNALHVAASFYPIADGVSLDLNSI